MGESLDRFAGGLEGIDRIVGIGMAERRASTASVTELR